MVMVTRPASCFSMSMVEPVEPVRVTRSPNKRIRHLERHLVLAWKTLTQATRRSPGASHVPSDFILITSRRRSVLPPPQHQKRHRCAQSA
ncbi:hypothetical protein AX15_003093 [Amanita polypyramis BW_CC]|nr:hypothetical protein AX15_003093 [Amanita polypyramis BW_CC]